MEQFAGRVTRVDAASATECYMVQVSHASDVMDGTRN